MLVRQRLQILLLRILLKLRRLGLRERLLLRLAECRRVRLHVLLLRKEPAAEL